MQNQPHSNTFSKTIIMKKIFLSMAVAVAMIGSAFAAPVKNEPSVTVKLAFEKEFADVKDVKWEIVKENTVYEATFMFNNESMQAYFSGEGEFLGTMRQISKSRLPVLAANALAKNYGGAYVVSVFEHGMPEALDYYITLSTEKGGLILQATGNGELTVYKRIKQ